MEDIKQRVEGYLNKAKGMFEGLVVETPEDVNISEAANKFHEMASSYYQDALHFYEKDEYVNALAALEYAEGWVDAGKTLGVFKK